MRYFVRLGFTALALGLSAAFPPFADRILLGGILVVLTLDGIPGIFTHRD